MKRLLLSVCAAIACSPALAEPQVKISFVGDVMLAESTGQLIRQGRDPFQKVEPLLQGDIRVANLECVVARKGVQEPDKPFTFRAHPRVLAVLKKHFGVVGLANNHSGDYGPAAFAEMLGHLSAQHMAYFGGGHHLDEAHRPLILEKNGLRIALLGYNEFFPRKFEADFDQPGIAWSEDEQVLLDIRLARERYGADLVIPVMHWGWEHEPIASPRQLALAHRMIEAGADAVVGGHPHVTQNIEQYQGKPIFYSLGNFVFNGFPDASNNLGWVLNMTLEKGTGVVSWNIAEVVINPQTGIPKPRKKTVPITSGT